MNEKIQCNLIIEPAKIFTLLFVNVHEYEDLRGEEISPPWQSRVIEQAKFIYSPFRKAFEKNVTILK